MELRQPALEDMVTTRNLRRQYNGNRAPAGGRPPHRKGRYRPGTHIPIYPPDMLRNTRPDYVLVLPWNLEDEIIRQTAYIREWDGKFLVPIPTVEVIE